MISIAWPRWLPPSEDRVFLDTHSLAWHRLPGSIQDELRDQREEIAAIRADIAKQAKVKVMPPVEISADTWVSQHYERYLHAGAGVVAVGRAMQFGVKISGASAMFADAVDLRELLLHEFNHCLWLTRQTLHGGVPPEDCRGLWLDCEMFVDEAFEESLADSPEDWFGMQDVQLFKWRARDVFFSGSNAIMHDWLIPDLPCTLAPSTYHHGVITIDPEVVDRCEELNARDLRHARSPRLLGR